MKRLIQLARRMNGNTGILRDERGLTTVEYVIILMLIAVLAIGAWKSFGGAVKAKVDASEQQIQELGAKDK